MVVVMCFAHSENPERPTSALLVVQSSTQQGVTLAAYGILDSKERVFHKYKTEDLLSPCKAEGLRFELLPTSAEEDRLIGMTSDTCRLLRMRFHYWDMILRMTPFANTDDVDLFKKGEDMRTANGHCLMPVSVSPTQIYILILRGCVDVANPLHAALKRLNSQTATPDDLLKAIAPSSKTVNFAYVQALMASYDYVHDMRDLYDCVIGKKF